MIAYLSGTVKAVLNHQIVLSVGGVGYALSVPASTSFQVGSVVDLHAHMHWNQENGPSLYGFVSDLEKQIFCLVISCSGIGPKIGLAVLSDLGAESFITAVQSSDDRALSKVNGIGAKKAEQMVVQLRHKVANFMSSGIEITQTGQAATWYTVSEALASLNYSRAEITRAMHHVKQAEGGTSSSFDQVMRQALSFLSKQS